MASYETETTLDTQAAIDRARQFFEEQQHLEVKDKLGFLYRWHGPEQDIIELRAYPRDGGGTRLELDTLRNDVLVIAFIKALPHTSWLDTIRRWLRRGP